MKGKKHSKDTEKVEEVIEEEEIEWRDSQIRWEEDANQTKADDDDNNVDHDEEYATLDPFATDPRTTFSFSFPRHGRPGDLPEQDPIRINLQGYTYESDQTWSSTGMTLWRASEYLCHFLIRHWDQDLLIQDSIHQRNESPDIQHHRERRVLELGAGLGLCSLVAHHLGDASTSVYVTDGDKDVLVELRKNVANHRQNRGQIFCHQLLWGKDTSAQFLNNNVVARRKFNIILAADVVYVKSVVQPLWDTVQALLDPDDDKAVFVLAFARRVVDVTVDDVLEAAEQAGFSHQLHSTGDDVKNGLYLYIFQRNRR